MRQPVTELREATRQTDHNTLAGIARAHARAAKVGMRLVVGCRLDLRDSLPVLAYPTDRAAYARLCRLLTLGKGRTGKGGCDLAWADLAAGGDGLLLVLLPGQPDDALAGALARLRRDFRGRCYVSLSLRRRPGDAVRLHRLAEMAGAAGVPGVVTGDVLYHAPERRILQDVVTCNLVGFYVVHPDPRDQSSWWLGWLANRSPPPGPRLRARSRDQRLEAPAPSCGLPPHQVAGGT